VQTGLVAEPPGIHGDTRTHVSPSARIAVRAAVVAAVVLTVVTVVLLAADAVDTDDGGGDTAPSTTRDPAVPTTSTTGVAVYDVDDDGRGDFAVIHDEVVAIPGASDESHLAEWLTFAGTIVAAIIGTGGLVGVARLNRDGGAELGRLNRRVDRLQPDRSTTESG
jgi:hypothetical protein